MSIRLGHCLAPALLFLVISNPSNKKRKKNTTHARWFWLAAALVGVMLTPCTHASRPCVSFARSGLMRGSSGGAFAQARRRYGPVRPALRHSLLPGIITMSACLKKHAYGNEKGAPLTASGAVLGGRRGCETLIFDRP